METSTSSAPNINLDVSSAVQNSPEEGVSLSGTLSVDEGNLSPTMQSIRADLDGLGIEELGEEDTIQTTKPSDCVIS